MDLWSEDTHIHTHILTAEKKKKRERDCDRETHTEISICTKYVQPDCYFLLFVFSLKNFVSQTDSNIRSQVN